MPSFDSSSLFNLSNPILQWWLIGATACSVIGTIIGMGKGTAGAGFMYGLLLGPLGLLLVAVAEDARVSCPVCREMIPQSATTCPKCRANMLKLGRESTSKGERIPTEAMAVREPPRVVPKVIPSARARTPRVVKHATQAVSKMTQTLERVTQVLDHVPTFFVRKPVKVVRNRPKAISVEEPPRVIPRAAPVAKQASRFFVLKPGDEVRGPYDLAQIQALTECGVIVEGTQFCREGENDWKPYPVA